MSVRPDLEHNEEHSLNELTSKLRDIVRVNLQPDSKEEDVEKEDVRNETDTVYLLEVTSLDDKEQGAWIAARSMIDVLKTCLSSKSHRVRVRRRYEARVTVLQLGGDWKILVDHYNNHVEPVTSNSKFIHAIAKTDFDLLKEMPKKELDQMMSLR